MVEREGGAAVGGSCSQVAARGRGQTRLGSSSVARA